MQNIDQLNNRLDNMDMALVKCAAEALAAHRAALVSDDAMELARSSGRLCATVENLLDVIEHVTRPNLAARDWEAEAAEREQFADVLAADEADQRRMDRTGTGWPA